MYPTTPPNTFLKIPAICSFWHHNDFNFLFLGQPDLLGTTMIFCS
uniref:Uncharacterized protein n=1 Tax=Anguilla anguilla TaxID=7936 RepID=A0A0E9Y0C3_ANGAN